VCPPETIKAIKGKVGGSSPKKFAKMCPSRWLTPIRGLFKARDKVFAAIIPIHNAPIRPGPWVTAIKSISVNSFFAFSKASSISLFNTST